jgi:hypothetical protein
MVRKSFDLSLQHLFFVLSGEVTTSSDFKQSSKFPKLTNSRTSTAVAVAAVAKALERHRRRKKKKSSYKHVPHAVKPPHLVAKRNARERNRVHAVNLAFVRLRKAIPFENKVRMLCFVL